MKLEDLCLKHWQCQGFIYGNFVNPTFNTVVLSYMCVYSLQVAFSSLHELLVPFTRDYEIIKAALNKLGDYNKTCLEPVLRGITPIVVDEWGVTVPCQVRHFSSIGFYIILIGFCITNVALKGFRSHLHVDVKHVKRFPQPEFKINMNVG